MNLKKTLIGLGIAACLAGSLFAQNKTSNSKETKMEAKQSLVVYFSLAGEQYNVGIIKERNTSIIAKFIAEETSSELFELETQKPYPTDSYSRLTQIAKDEQNKKARPAYKGDIDTSGYDTIYIGYPIWWGDLPMVCYTFLEKHDLSGKTIVPFCTHEGSGLSGTDGNIKKLYKNVTMKKALVMTGRTAQNNRNEAEKQVDEWL